MRAILGLGGVPRKVQGAGANAPLPPAASDDDLPRPLAELEPAYAAGGARAGGVSKGDSRPRSRRARPGRVVGRRGELGRLLFQRVPLVAGERVDVHHDILAPLGAGDGDGREALDWRIRSRRLLMVRPPSRR